MCVRFLFCAVAAKWSLAGAWRGVALLWTSPVVSEWNPARSAEDKTEAPSACLAGNPRAD